MADGKISEYTVSDEIPGDFDKFDKSELISIGPDVYVSKAVDHRFLKGIIAQIDNQALAATGKFDFIWNSTTIDKETLADVLWIKNVVSSKSLDDLEIQVNKKLVGSGDIVPFIRLIGFSAGAWYKIPIGGLIPSLLSDSDDYELEIISDAGIAFCDFFITGFEQDAP